MRTIHGVGVMLACLLWQAGWSQDTPAQTTVKVSCAVEVVRNGAIDWSQGEIQAVGMGVAPTTASGAQARLLAREAAIVAAERNLVKIVAGVRVTSETTVQNLMLVNDVIKTRVDGFIKGATIVKETAQADGSYEVVLALNMYGGAKNLAERITVNTQLAPKLTEQPIVLQPRTPATTSVVPPPPPPADSYTGLIIDCRGLPLAKSMCPRILDQQGRDLWSVLTLSTELIYEKGLAAFFVSTADPQLRKRVGDKPLTITAMRLDGGKSFKTNTVVSPADVERIRDANSKGLFLEKLAVAFLVDE